MLRESTCHTLRHIFQHKIDLWGDKDQKEALKVFFKLSDDEIKAIHELGDFISNHGLERDMIVGK